MSKAGKKIIKGLKEAIVIAPYMAVIQKKNARIARLETALKDCVEALEASHNLRATDMTIKDFDDALARNVGRDCLEFIIDHSSSIHKALAALGQNNSKYITKLEG